MKSTWTIKDIIDLEYLLEKNSEELPAKQLHEQDRTFFLQQMEPKLSASTSCSNKELLQLWLSEKRKERPTDMPLPGQLFSESFLLIKLCLLLISLITGAALTGIFLNYDGTTPVNIFGLLAALLLPQLVLLLLMLLNTAATKTGALSHTRPTLYSMAKRGMLVLILRIKKDSFTRLSGTNRLEVQLLQNRIEKISNQYRSIFTAQIFALFQLFAVGFNLSVLTTLLLKIIGTDIAFGWQSTLRLSTEAVYTFCTAMASSWHWLLNIQIPTLQEIEGSRIILKDGIYFLKTPDLVSWWPFLFMSLLVYGLLPRLLLLFGSQFSLTAKLRKIKFDQLKHKELIYRLTEPFLSTQASQPAAEKLSLEAVHSRKKKVIREETQVIVLVPEELIRKDLTEDLRRHLHPLQFTLSSILEIQMDQESDVQKIKNETGMTMDVFILLEGWMPPIMDTLSYISAIRRNLSPDKLIHIGLLGKPNIETIFTQPSEQDVDIWQAKVSGLNAANIFVAPVSK